MSTATDLPIRETSVLAQVWLDPDLASALDRAVRDSRTNRADYMRRLIVDAVRAAGHLPQVTTPRRHRVKRRQEIAE